MLKIGPLLVEGERGERLFWLDMNKSGVTGLLQRNLGHVGSEVIIQHAFSQSYLWNLSTFFSTSKQSNLENPGQECLLGSLSVLPCKHCDLTCLATYQAGTLTGSWPRLFFLELPRTFLGFMYSLLGWIHHHHPERKCSIPIYGWKQLSEPAYPKLLEKDHSTFEPGFSDSTTQIGPKLCPGLLPRGWNNHSGPSRSPNCHVHTSPQELSLGPLFPLFYFEFFLCTLVRNSMLLCSSCSF